MPPLLHFTLLPSLFLLPFPIFPLLNKDAPFSLGRGLRNVVSSWVVPGGVQPADGFCYIWVRICGSLSLPTCVMGSEKLLALGIFWVTFQLELGIFKPGLGLICCQCKSRQQIKPWFCNVLVLELCCTCPQLWEKKVLKLTQLLEVLVRKLLYCCSWYILVFYGIPYLPIITGLVCFMSCFDRETF